MGKHQVFLINGALGYVSLHHWGQVTESVSDESYKLSFLSGEQCKIWTNYIITVLQFCCRSSSISMSIEWNNTVYRTVDAELHSRSYNGPLDMTLDMGHCVGLSPREDLWPTCLQCNTLTTGGTQLPTDWTGQLQTHKSRKLSCVEMWGWAHSSLNVLRAQWRGHKNCNCICRLAERSPNQMAIVLASNHRSQRSPYYLYQFHCSLIIWMENVFFHQKFFT